VGIPGMPCRDLSETPTIDEAKPTCRWKRTIESPGYGPFPRAHARGESRGGSILPARKSLPDSNGTTFWAGAPLLPRLVPDGLRNLRCGRLNLPKLTGSDRTRIWKPSTIGRGGSQGAYHCQDSRVRDNKHRKAKVDGDASTGRAGGSSEMFGVVPDPAGGRCGVGADPSIGPV
jgi:hypothetical protein